MTIIRFNNLKIVTILILLGGCMSSQKEADPYKEGEVVTWKFNDQFILKTKLGARRTHISTGPHDAEFYRPESEHYVGQFPIDYVPQKFAKLTEAQARQMQPVAIIAGQQLEFNLMLNGSIVQATDKGLDALNTLDHPDQIKVLVTNTRGNAYSTKEAYLKGREKITGTYEQNSSEMYGLKCHRDEDIGLSCFGESKNNQISGVSFSFWSSDKVRAVSYESVYGGIQVEWYINQRQLKHWQEVDLAIWNILNNWNVSPVKTN